MEIVIRNGDIEKGIRLLRRVFQSEGIYKELKYGEFFESKGQRRRRKIRQNAVAKRKREQKARA